MSTFLALLPFLLALGVALHAHWRAYIGFKAIGEALEPLLNEQERIELRRLELENELDVRIKRLLAREQYWRGEATRSDGADSSAGAVSTAEPSDARQTAESPLSLRERLRHLRGA